MDDFQRFGRKNLSGLEPQNKGGMWLTFPNKFFCGESLEHVRDESLCVFAQAFHDNSRVIVFVGKF